MRILLSTPLILVISSTLIWAQSTAQIAGTVTDQSGAVLPGVEVSVTQTDTGLTRSAVTNETGSYSVTSLARRPSWPSPLVRRSAMRRPVSGPSGRSRTRRFA